MSLFDCQRTFDETVEISALKHTPDASHGTHTTYLKRSRFDRDRIAGGGEGIRTPDPRVANAVLCQLSYAPDKLLRFQI